MLHLIINHLFAVRISMKTLLLALVTFLSVQAQVEASGRQCLARLTQDYTLDSRSFHLNLDEIQVRDFGRDYVAQAISLVRVVVGLNGCSQQDINFGQSLLGRSKHSCRELVQGRELSRVCYIETNLGGFVVTYDYLDHAYVVFKRWD